MKKTITIILTLSLALTLTACDKNPKAEKFDNSGNSREKTSDNAPIGNSDNSPINSDEPQDEINSEDLELEQQEEETTEKPAETVAEETAFKTPSFISNYAWNDEKTAELFTDKTYAELVEEGLQDDFIACDIEVLWYGYSDIPGRFTDLSLFSNLKTLRNISIGLCDDLTDLTPLLDFPNLTSFTLTKTEKYRKVDAPPLDISVLSNFPDMEYLRFAYCKIDDISALAGLTKLTTLVVSDCNLTDEDLDVIAGLTELEYLAIGGNQITDISALSGLDKVKTLFINDMEISDLTPLYSMTSLKEVYTRKLPITDEQKDELREAFDGKISIW